MDAIFAIKLRLACDKRPKFGHRKHEIVEAVGKLPLKYGNLFILLRVMVAGLAASQESRAKTHSLLRYTPDDRTRNGFSFFVFIFLFGENDLNCSVENALA